MSETISKMLVALIAIAALIIAPAMIISLKSDNISQELCENAVTEFVDTSRLTCKITKHNYYTLMDTLNTYCPGARIELVHDARTYKDGKAYTDRYVKDDISEHLRTSDYYELRSGDYLYVSAYNTKPTIGAKLYSLINPKELNSVSVIVKYGGAVLNNSEE